MSPTSPVSPTSSPLEPDAVDQLSEPVIALDDVTERVLTALLAIGHDDAERVRVDTPARARPRRQVGPTVDLGD